MSQITLKQAIANLNQDNYEPVWDVEEFMDALGLQYCYVDGNLVEARLKAQYLIKWYCTDTYVGTCVFQLDGVPVAITTQNGRKCDTHVTFLNAAGADAMRVFCLSLMQEEEQNSPYILPDDEMIDEFYTVDYGSQMLTKFGFYNGEPVEVVRTWDGYAMIHNWHDVEVRLPDGTLKTINTKEFMIPVGT